MLWQLSNPRNQGLWRFSLGSILWFRGLMSFRAHGVQGSGGLGVYVVYRIYKVKKVYGALCRVLGVLTGSHCQNGILTPVLSKPRS